MNWILTAIALGLLFAYWMIDECAKDARGPWCENCNRHLLRCKCGTDSLYD